ncbi:MAG: translation initiation factor IF-3 [Bdellovibrionales bacterium]|nr:translation initiation factor IF-3 [Bdellovibrionales bacterium]
MIRVPRVRVIDPEGKQLGVLDTHEALRTAMEKYNLDLIEISPTADPPVCKIMDFGKFKYQLKKKEQEAKKNQSVIIVKEIKLRPSTDQHDFDFKLKHIERFLEEGNKVKVTIRFFGRELVHSDLGKVMLNRIAEAVTKKAQIEQYPKLEGRTMIMVLGPQKQKE